MLQSGKNFVLVCVFVFQLKVCTNCWLKQCQTCPVRRRRMNRLLFILLVQHRVNNYFISDDEYLYISEACLSYIISRMLHLNKTRQDKCLFQCGRQEAGLVKYDKYTCKRWAIGLGYNKNTRYKIHNKQFAIWKNKMYNEIQITYCSGSWQGHS